MKININKIIIHDKKNITSFFKIKKKNQGKNYFDFFIFEMKKKKRKLRRKKIREREWWKEGRGKRGKDIS